MNNSAQIRLAQRASQNKSLVARLVAIHLESERQSWDEAAEALGISSDQLARLSLCNRPRDTKFMEDIAQIAGYVKVNRNTLVHFIRHTEALEQMQTSDQNQWLMAARDNDSEIDDDSGDKS